jgi:hypothetical protein
MAFASDSLGMGTTAERMSRASPLYRMNMGSDVVSDGKPDTAKIGVTSAA